MVDRFVVDATGTRVQEPRVDGHSTHETPVREASAHKTPVPGATSQETPAPEALYEWGPDRIEGLGGHADGGGDECTDSEGEVFEGVTMYQRGGTRLPAMSATREQRPLIRRAWDK